MVKRRQPDTSAIPPTPAPPPDEAEDQGLSLEELGQAYAEALSGGATPYAEPAIAPREEASPVAPDLSAAPEFAQVFAPGGASPADDHCELTPSSILEALLFVGRPDNQPITSTDIARLMRGVRPIEVDELVAELNRTYDSEQAPYRIASVGAGYRLELRSEYDRLCRQVYGKVREVRLSQAAIDCLAIVAYRQPVRREEIDGLRGKSSGAPLALLVRRGLVRLERNEDSPNRPAYRTTTRFLEIFQLQRLDDLPQAQQIEVD